MELILLGTGTCAPDPRRAPAGYFLSVGAGRFLIDPGPGAMGRAAAAGLDVFDIEAIVLTHHHLDHSADVMPYLFSYKNCLRERVKRDVRIIAPEGFTSVYEKLLDVYGQWVLSNDYSIRIEEVSRSVIEFPGGVIRSAPMLHGANAVGYRFQKTGGPSFVYSGDTGYCEELIELARDADVLLCECSYPDGMNVEGHMTPSEVAQVGHESGARKIVLTHFYPVLDTATVAAAVRKAGYAGEVVVGEDGMRVVVG